MNRNRRNLAQKKNFVYGGVQNANNSSSPAAQSGGQWKTGTLKNEPVTPIKPPPPLPAVIAAPLVEHIVEDISEEVVVVPEQELAEDVNATVEQIEDDEGGAEADDTMDDNKEGKKFSFKTIFRNRKKSSVRQKEKKLRQNRQLRKALLPKNALMALYEVKGIAISDFNITASPGGGFTAQVTVNGKQHEGRGHTKMGSKNSACEKALRDYIIEKMTQKPRLPVATGNTDEAMEADGGADAEGGEGAGADENGDGNEDMPMTNLASFAIYKLFTEWENEGFFIPELHPAMPNGGVAVPTKPGEEGGAAAVAPPKEPKPLPIRTELPLNWESMHPCTLLCMMRPGLTYSENPPVGEKPELVQSVSTVADGGRFTGTGRSKKMARRNCAALVCNKLFNTNFGEEQ